MDGMALGLAATVALLLGGTAVFLGILWFLLPLLDSKRCPSCAARRPLAETICAMCASPLPGPADRHPGAVPYGYPEATASRPRRPEARVEDGVAYNRGITRRAVTIATGAMGLGIGLRVLGMLGALGLPALPAHIDGVLTVVGGIVAFVGFVFLDAA